MQTDEDAGLAWRKKELGEGRAALVDALQRRCKACLDAAQARPWIRCSHTKALIAVGTCTTPPQSPVQAWMRACITQGSCWLASSGRWPLQGSAALWTQRAA